MSNTFLLDAEARLAEDQDGSYKSQLIEFLETHQSQIETSRQGFLPPDEYEAFENLGQAVEAAINILNQHQSAQVTASEPTHGSIYMP